MKKLLLIVIPALLIFTSCQKELTLDTPVMPGSGSGSSATNDYQPTSAGSEWNYTSTTLGNIYVKSLGTDTTINGEKYYKFDRTNSLGTARGYFSKTNGVYKEFGNYSPIGGPVEFIRLKDASIGTTWTNTITLSGFSNYHKFTVAAKDIQYTVNGKLYKDVIQLDYEMLADNPLGGGTMSLGTGKYHFAKGVGSIEAYYKTTYSGSDTTRLVSYTIR